LPRISLQIPYPFSLYPNPIPTSHPHPHHHCQRFCGDAAIKEVVTGDMGSCCRRKERRRPVAGGGRGCSGRSLLPIAAPVCGWREWRGAAVPEESCTDRRTRGSRPNWRRDQCSLATYFTFPLSPTKFGRVGRRSLPSPYAPTRFRVYLRRHPS
jgi:hypothetical protein